MAELIIKVDTYSFKVVETDIKKQLIYLNEKFKVKDSCVVIYKDRQYNNLCSLCPKYLLRTFFPEKSNCTIDECESLCKTLMEDNHENS